MNTDSRIENLVEKMQYHFDNIVHDNAALFVTNCDKDRLWELYLDSFPEGTNPIYRTRREYDCQCCKRFIKEIGPVVYVDHNYNLRSVFDFNSNDDTYNTVLNALNKYVTSFPIISEYLSKNPTIGTKVSYEWNEESKVSIPHSHFYLTMPKKIIFPVNSGNSNRKAISDMYNKYMSETKVNKNVFRSSLESISTDSVDTVMELIDSNTLYRGEEAKYVISEFQKARHEYDNLDPSKKDNFCWIKSLILGAVISRIKNKAIGTLLTDISEGMDLDSAVRRYESIMAPANYKRPKPIFTKKMVEEAEKTVKELGYMDSLPRRFAKVDDITVNNVLFVNRDTVKDMKNSNSIFDELKNKADIVTPKEFSRVENIGIEKFINGVIPYSREMDALFENRLSKNLVSLIAPVNSDAKPLFKWNNNFCWSYKGNIADRDIRENVMAAGGKVEGFMRFSIQWNDEGEWDKNDLDAHCIETLKGGELNDHIMFSHKSSRFTDGELDIDIINPKQDKPAVENIIYSDKNRILPGTYEFGVHCYSYRGGNGGFRAELEVNGQLYSFDYANMVPQGHYVKVATVKVEQAFVGGYPTGEMTYTVVPYIKNNNFNSRDIWGISTNHFVPVTMVLMSPNYWDGMTGIGNKHYMFMLKNCVNPEKPNGFYNEYLKNELNPHRKIFEALGSKMAVPDSDDQLSGLGFSSTIKNELFVKVKGNTERVMKVVF